MTMTRTQQDRIRFVLTLIVLWLAGLYLRLPILIVPPLEPLISNTLDLGAVATGALTTMPMLMLSVGAIAGSSAVGRLGARTAVVLGLTLIALASAARGLAPPITVLFVATLAVGLGVAMMQPALAALANALTPARVALAVGIYMNGMYAGEFASAGLTRMTLLPLLGNDWRLVLLCVSAPAILIAVAVAFLRAPGSAGVTETAPQRPPLWPDWRNPVMWQLGFLLSATSVLFVGTNAYMAKIVGSSDSELAAALFWFNLSQVVVSLVMLSVANRLVMRRGPLIATMLASLAGALVFVFVGGGIGLVAAFVLGMATALQLTLVVMAAPYLAPVGETGRMSAGIFTIGYSLAFFIPLIGGGVAEWTGVSWTAMLPMIGYAMAVLPIAFTIRLRRPG
ncbi:MFS transporter [Salinisphaera orenii]|uniref:MFS transporter n=1 Tax=Salinisphaera orenii TaxID=856731 RepID=UPI000DBE8D1C